MLFLHIYCIISPDLLLIKCVFVFANSISGVVTRMDTNFSDALSLATVAVGINAIDTVAVTTVTHQPLKVILFSFYMLRDCHIIIFLTDANAFRHNSTIIVKILLFMPTLPTLPICFLKMAKPTIPRF